MTSIRKERAVAAFGLQACGSIEASSGWRWIIVPRPTDFNDAGTFDTLGHEFMHNPGATHR